MGRIPDLQTIGLFDHTGVQICNERDDLCRGVNVADRDYFLRYRNTPSAGAGIFGPFDSRLDGRRVLILARALRQGDGRFAGVAVGLLPLQRLEAIVATASLGPGGVASLRVAGTLTLLARAPVLPPARQDAHLASLERSDGEVMWFSTDVTEARRAEGLRIEAAGLAAENRQLQETARLHSIFLSNMSHELRTPLNAIVGFVQLLQRPSMAGEPEKRERYLGQIGASSKHLQDMIESLLDLAKVEAGRVPLHPIPLEPGAVVQEVVDMLEGNARDRGVTLRSESPRLPTVRLDPLRLKQVLLNYVSNAIKFSHANGQVVVNAYMPEPARLRIEVQDHGIGISEADQSQLFVRFRQLSVGATKAFEGTGTGLALVKQIVEAQGGRVGVRSALGQGSVFWAEWPVVP
ncbi:MAG: hypothetical protein JNM26_02395 [Ideonella sp.]|nr:hypothetical protein [Ideonella sp.]